MQAISSLQDATFLSCLRGSENGDVTSNYRDHAWFNPATG
jgi:hypothetical protein